MNWKGPRINKSNAWILNENKMIIPPHRHSTCVCIRQSMVCTKGVGETERDKKDFDCAIFMGFHGGVGWVPHTFHKASTSSKIFKWNLLLMRSKFKATKKQMLAVAMVILYTTISIHIFPFSYIHRIWLRWEKFICSETHSSVKMSFRIHSRNWNSGKMPAEQSRCTIYTSPRH